MVDYISNIDIGKEVDSGVPDGENWTLLTSSGISGGTNYYAITYGSNKFVALGSTGYVSTSTDGTTWTTATYNGNLSGVGVWYGLAYDGTKFVSLSSSGYVSTSTDGTTWTTAVRNVNLGSNNWFNLTYDGTKFVALSSTGYISISIDGTRWSPALQSPDLGSLYWYGLAYDGTKFVTLGNYGYISTSVDGTTWTTPVQVSNLGSNNWFRLAYDGTKFVALSSYGYISTSTDGTTWSIAVQNTSLGSNNWRGLTYGADKFIAMGTSGSTSISFNGTSWANVGGLGSYNWKAVEYDGTKFIAQGAKSSYGYISTSTDGISWTTPQSISNVSLVAGTNIAYGLYGASGNSPTQSRTLLVVAANNSSGNYHISTDGINWTTYTASALASRAWKCLATSGYYWSIITADGYISTSIDGVTWEATKQDTILKTYTDWAFSTYGDAHFVAISASGYVAYSIDGTAWTLCTDTLSTSASGSTWANIKFVKGKFVATSSNGYVSVGTPYYSAGTVPSWNNDNFQISWSTPVLSSSLSGADTWRGIAYGNGKFVSLGYNGKVAVSENVKSSKIAVGGDIFNSSPGDSRGRFYLYNRTGVGTEILFPNSPFSLESYLPDDDYDYEVQFALTAYTNTTAENNVAITVAPGSVTTYSSNIFMHAARMNTRSASSQGVWASFWLPVYANDRNISVYQAGNSGTTGIVSMVAINYRRVGTNNEGWSKAVQNANLGSNSWNDIAYGDGKFVAIGYGGYISTSTDGTTWTTAVQNANLGSNSWSDIAYGDGKFVVIGSAGHVSTSTDGTTWTTAVQNTNLGSNSWTGITYGNGKFVAIGYIGYTSTSTDGTTWTTAVQNANLGSHDWSGIAYGDGKFVAIGYGGYISTSTDGTTWTTAVQNANLGIHNWSDIAYGDGKFVVIDYYSGYISTSTDGTIWTTAVQNANLGSNRWTGITYGNGKFVAIGSTGYTSQLYVGYISNISVNGDSSVPIGGDCLDSKWQQKYLQPFSGTSLGISAKLAFDLSSYLPNDGYRYEVLIGQLRVITASSNGASTRVSLRTADYSCPFWVTMALTRSSNGQFDSRNCTVTVPAHDRRVFIENTNNNTGTIYLSVTGYRRLSNND